MKQVKRALLVLATLALASCGTTTPGSSSSSSASSSSSSSSSSSVESISSSEESSSSSEVSSTSLSPAIYTIGFYDGQTLLFSEELEEGEPVKRPENDPTKEGYTFLGWYKDSELTEPFSFGEPATRDTAVFASFRLSHTFDEYNEEVIPQYSPLTSDDAFVEGDKDIEISILATEVGLVSSLPNKAVHLFGAFEDLTVKELVVENNHLTVRTEGSVKAGEGHIALSKDSTDADAYLTLSIPVSSRHAEIDASTYRYGSGEKDKIDFTIGFTNMEIAHEEGMNRDQYKEAVNSGQIPYFTVNSDRYSVQMLELAEDFSTLRFRMTLPGPLDQSIAEDLRDNVRFCLAKEAFVSGFDQELTLDLLNPRTKTKMTLSYDSGANYKATFEMKLQNCQLTDGFKNHAAAFLSEPNNKNAFFTFPGGIDTTLTSLEVVDITTVKGSFTVNSSFIDHGFAMQSLGKFTMGEDEFHFAKSWVTQQDCSLLPQLIRYDISFETSSSGKVSQSAAGSYGTVKNTLSFVSNEGESELMKIVSIATNLGKLGFGLYSGDFTMASNSVGELLGIDSLLSPTNQILKALQGVMDKLDDIEHRIDSLASQMLVLQAELEQLGQLSIYTNFMAANTGWNDFLTSYYTPLKNEINSYSTEYFRYYYDLAVASMPNSDQPKPSVTLYYDNQGELAFPGDNPAISIDGRTIDKKATRVVEFPELVHALSGIRQNSGHSYTGIEDDIIVDILAHDNLDEDLLGDVLMKIRFDAMKNYFNTPAKIHSFCNVFENFCNSISANQMGGQGGFSPLDYYTTMLETACNFGFETEADINLCIIKLQATFFNARAIINFVSSINPGEVQTSRYDQLASSVNEEFASTRFFHPNRPDLAGKGQYCIYSYAASSYVKYSHNKYGLNADYEEDGEATCNDGDLPSTYTSIDEATARLMKVKVKAYNRIHNTNYSFKEYLASLGMIPEDKMDQTWGICVGLSGLVEGKEAAQLTYYKPKMTSAELGNNASVIITEDCDDYDADRDWDKRYAIKGNVVSLDDDRSFTGLLAVFIRTDEVDWMDCDVVVRADYVGISDSPDDIIYGRPVHAYYCTFEPISVS